MRHNIFNNAHSPLKAALLNTCIQLANSKIAPLAMAEKIKTCIRQFKEQAAYEADYILPLVFEYEPAVWDNYVKEHQQGMNLGRNVEGLILGLEHMADHEQVDGLMKLIIQAFDAFMRFNFTHMEEEEEVLNEIFWRYYSDKILMEIPTPVAVRKFKVEREAGMIQRAYAA